MIHVLTPFVAKVSSRDWNLASRLLQETLMSLEYQTYRDFRVVVCGHDQPEDFDDFDERFRFVPHVFPAPVRPKDGRVPRGPALRDMGLKRDVALHYAEPRPDDFVFLLDADDLLHRETFQEVAQRQALDAVLLDRGYEFCHQSRRAHRRDDMLSRCSSTYFFKAHLLNVPESLDEADLGGTLYHDVWHGKVHEYLRSAQKRYEALPNPRVLYRVNTSVNNSDTLRTSLFQRLRQRLKFLFAQRLDLSEWGASA